MVERAEQSSLTVHSEIARGPHRRRADIGREYCVGSSHFVNDTREILGMDGFTPWRAGGQMVEACAIAGIVS